MSDRDILINWLYNNDEVEVDDCAAVYALELYDEGKRAEDIRQAIRGY